MIKYYVDTDGNYLGAFTGSKPKDTSAIEVSSPPGHAGQKWDGGKFLPYVNIQEQIAILQSSITERNKRGLRTNDQ